MSSNSMSNDYFSFMSDKWENKHSRQPQRLDQPTKPVRQSDTIDFVEEAQIEVTESFVSDTTIQRIFKRWSNG
ncbi:MAG TPA: hypothetical protein VNR70_06535 [Steroidobacteraceae bacterium]|nr:hypothetical protein [Steroidobacteraceae bacterium]